jgi:hypothetical protein
MKTSILGRIDEQLCPVFTLYTFIERTKEIRKSLPEDHTLFLAYILTPEKTTSIRPSTLSNWVKTIMGTAGVDTKIYSAHSIRSAASTKAVEKKHANWSLIQNTFEKFYYKPSTTTSTSTQVSNSTKNHITLEPEAEETPIVIGTTNNHSVSEAEYTHPWFKFW